MQTLISYSQELREKKTAARIFWLVVFLFAGFLYFFFQGYYPNIEFRLANIGSGILSGEERGVTIRSFGIVNVKASPPDSLLTLNSSSYGNNEKRMIDYGEYTMTISRDNYLSGAIHFSINKEKPFYIDTLTLIPKPGYVPYPRKIENIAKIDTDSWTAQSASGMILFENGFATGTLISRGNMTHIGEGRFLSGNMIVSYDLSTQTWVNEENKAWESFLKRCGTVIVENKILFCPKTQEGISSEENIFTGILNIRNDYIKTTAGIITYGNGGPKKIISFSGVTVKDDTQFILVENHWYLVQMGLLVSVTGEKKRIITPLESIQHIEWVNNNLLIFGKK